MHEPWWITIPKAFIVINVVMLFFAFTTWLERKLLGRMQLRYGPNRAGPKGLLVPIADLLKLIRKEAFSPSAAKEPLYILAPIVSMFTALLAFSVLPFGAGWTVDGYYISGEVVNVPISLILIFRLRASAGESQTSRSGRWNCSSGVRSTAMPENKGRYATRRRPFVRAWEDFARLVGGGLSPVRGGSIARSPMSASAIPPKHFEAISSNTTDECGESSMSKRSASFASHASTSGAGATTARRWRCSLPSRLIVVPSRSR